AAHALFGPEKTSQSFKGVAQFFGMFKKTFYALFLMREIPDQIRFHYFRIVGQQIIVIIAEISFDSCLRKRSRVITSDKIKYFGHQPSRTHLIQPVDGTIKAKILTLESCKISSGSAVQFKYKHRQSSFRKNGCRG